MLRLSLKKLKKIQDRECLLHKTVLINNTMSNIRRGHHDDEYDISNYRDNYDISNYSPEEEQILNSIRLPAPITPISDAKDTTEDNMDTTNNPAESITAAVITNTEHGEHNQGISADKHKHATTVV